MAGLQRVAGLWVAGLTGFTVYSFHQMNIKTHSFLFSIFVFILTFILSKLGRLFNLQFKIKTNWLGLLSEFFCSSNSLGLFSGGFIIGWAYYREITVCSP